jgi:hypothetical protein
MVTDTLQTITSSVRGVSVWLRSLPGAKLWPWRYLVIISVQAADEVPAKLPARTAVVVTSKGRPSWIAFDCPRHRRERLLINLSSARRPRWSLQTDTLLTLSPSIDAVHHGERCHFWIRRGKVVWQGDNKHE